MAIMFTNELGTFFEPSLLQQIKQRKNAEILPILKNVNPNQLTASDGTTLLHFAGKYGNEQLTKHLIELGVAVDAQNRYNETPLMLAVDANQETTVRVLLEASADIFLPDINSCSTLGRALKKNYIRDKIVSMLLDKVTVESLNSSRYANSPQFHLECPVYYFIAMKNVHITRILLKNGSLVDARDPSFQETALHMAAKELDLNNIRVLLEYKADINAKRYDGKTPLALVPVDYDENQSEAVEIVKALIAAGAFLIDIDSKKYVVWLLLRRGNRDIVRTILESQIDLQFMDEDGVTALHILARNGNPGVLEEIKDIKSAAKVRSKTGETMLHYAALFTRMNAIKYLLDNGADINTENEYGITPLFWMNSSIIHCKMYSEEFYDNLHCMDILLEHGAYPRLITNETTDFSSISDRYVIFYEPNFAQLALIEASGQSIEESLRKQIELCRVYKTVFNEKKLQLQDMKQIKIDKSVSLVDFLMASDEKISLYARNPRLIYNLNEIIKEYCNPDLYYHRQIQKRFLKASQLAEMRKNLAASISEIFTGFFKLSVYSVAKTVVNYLDDEELYNMLPNSK